MKHLVITIHGIQTFGQWQGRLERLLKEAEPEIEVDNYTYGYFSILAFLIPLTRWIVTRRFRSHLQRRLKSDAWSRVDIVAHSFGTHIVAWGLYGIPERERPQIHALILAGSVLKSKFPWHKLYGRGVNRVVNECGTKDFVLALNQAIVLFTGMAGRIGFYGLTSSTFRNRFHRFGHSGYFLKQAKAYDEFMKKNWVPLLTTDEDIPVIDERGRPTALQGILTFALNNSEPIKLTFYLTPALLLVLWVFGQWQNAVGAGLASESIRLQAQEPDLALLLSHQAYTETDNFQTRSAVLTTLQSARWVKSYIYDHVSGISGVAFSPDGSRLASVQEFEGRRLVVRDTNSLQKVIVYPEALPTQSQPHIVSADGYTGVSFSQDGRAILLWRRNEVEIISADNGKPINNISFEGSMALHFASQKQAYLIEGYVVLQDFQRSSLRYLWPDERVQQLLFTEDGQFLVGVTQEKVLIQNLMPERIEDDEFKIWRLPPAVVIPSGPIRKIAVSADRRFVGAVGEGEIRVWDFDSGRLLWKSSDTHELLERDIAFWPGRDLVVTSGGGGSTGAHSITVWRASTGEYLGPMLVGFEHATTALAFSGDGRFLASGDNSGKLILWEFSEEPFLGKTISCGTEKPVRFAVNPTEPVLILGYPSGKLMLYNYVNGAILVDGNTSPGGAPRALTYGPSGRRVYFAKEDGEVSVWDSRSLTPIANRKVLMHGHLVGLQATPDESKLVALDGTGEIIFLDANSLQELFRDSTQEAVIDRTVNPVAFLMKGRVAITPSMNFLWTWDVNRAQRLGRFLAGQVSGVLTRPNGRTLAIVEGWRVELVNEEGIRVLSNSRPDTLRDLAFSPPGVALKGHTEPITAAAYSRDGKLLATSSLVMPPIPRPDGQGFQASLTRKPLQSIFLWDGEAGSQLGKPLIWAGDSISQLDFSFDSEHLFSISEKGEFVDWKVAPRQWSEVARTIANRELTQTEKVRFLGYQSRMYRILASTRRVCRRIWNTFSAN